MLAFDHLVLTAAGLDAVAGRLGREPAAMRRTTADGTVLSWRLVGLEAMLAEALPFFIAWDVPEKQHPGRMRARHRSRPGGIAWVELGGDPDRLAGWLGGHDLDIRCVGGPPGVRSAGIATAAGEAVLRR